MATSPPGPAYVYHPAAVNIDESQQKPPDSNLNGIQRAAPCIAVVALIASILLGFMVLYNYHCLNILRYEHSLLVKDVEHHQELQSHFAQDLEDMLQDSIRSHAQSLEALEASLNSTLQELHLKHEVQQGLLRDLTSLMNESTLSQQDELRKLEEKMKKSLEESGYKTDHFNSDGNRQLGSGWLLSLLLVLSLSFGN